MLDLNRLETFFNVFDLFLVDFEQPKKIQDGGHAINMDHDVIGC